MKPLLLFCFLLYLLPPLSAQQNGEVLREAFRTSYARESEENYQAAIDALLQVYQPSGYEVNLRLGWLYYLKGDHFKSKDYYQKAGALLPYAIEAKLGYVLPLAALGNWNEVVTTYESILHIDPQNTIAHYRLGAILYERQDYENAYRHAEVVVNLYPFDYDANVLFGWICLRTGKIAKARALFQKALLNQPEGASALEGLRSIK